MLEDLAKSLGTTKENIEKWVKNRFYKYVLQESKDKEFNKYIEDKIKLLSVLLFCLYFFELSTFA